MSWLAKMICQFKPCVWRRARAKEDKSKRYCARGCGASIAIQHRKKGETQ